MAGPMYFQWQNEVLLKTIYPLRTLKLIDFLVYYKEIDLWKEYQDRKLEHLGDEINKYQAAKKKGLTDAVDAFNYSRDYFLKADVRLEYDALFKEPGVDEAEMAKINDLHTIFTTYFDKIKDPRKETYFVSQRLHAWEQHLKDLRQAVAQKQGYLNRMHPDHKDRPLRTQELETLRTIAIPMAQEEFKRLGAFLAASNHTGKRRQELATRKQNAQRNRPGVESRLMPLRQRIADLEVKDKTIEEELARLQAPPDLWDTVQKHFSIEDVIEQIRSRFQNAEQKFLNTVNDVHMEALKILNGYEGDDVKLFYLKPQIGKLQGFQRRIARGTAGLDANLKDNYLQAVAAELGRLNNLRAALERSTKSSVEWNGLIKAQEKEKTKVSAQLLQLRKEAEGLEQQLDSINAMLAMDVDQFLTESFPSQPKKEEIVGAMVQEYRDSISKRNHYELLQDVVQRFRNEPERFPRWLQYMVIHFSGMRYASAHGSWADPKDLLVSLQAIDLEESFRTKDDNEIEGLCREKIEVYQPSGITFPGSRRLSTKLAQTMDTSWKRRIADHLARLNKGLAYHSAGYQRQALIDLILDEFTYEVEEVLPPEKVSEVLLAYKDKLPGWMWSEIVRLTDLRVQEVNDSGWETLMPEQKAQQYEKQAAPYREIMKQWKEKHLTAWREEHDRSVQLIVTRAVCNEVAEHIQHLRGHTPPGGLTAKAPWYVDREEENIGTPPPYFVRPKSKEDFTVGASILWLRFVNEYPNEWRIAHPLQTANVSGLIPPGYISRKGKKEGYWVYTQGKDIKRSRTRPVDKKRSATDRQWLRWIHEATVAEVAETAEGTVVLTFETNLPEDDRSSSCIGLFKRYLEDLKLDGGEDNYNACFVGFVPEGIVNEENLREMLDWDKILSKPIAVDG